MAKFHKTREHDVLLKLLREARERAGLSQNELSRQLGRQSNYINRVELGRHSIDVVTTYAIVEAIGVNPKQFFAEFVEAIEGLR